MPTAKQQTKNTAEEKTMHMWYEPDFDLDAFLQSMDEERTIPAWKKIEEYEDNRKLREQLAWYEDDSETHD